MTDSQQKVLAWMASHDGWHRPGSITPADYPGGASSIGRILRSLVEQGRVEVRGEYPTARSYRKVLVYRSKSTIKFGRRKGV